MWLIAGTVPENGFPFYTGGIWEDSKVEGDMLVLPNGKKLPVARGATALAATAIMASQARRQRENRDQGKKKQNKKKSLKQQQQQQQQ